MIRKPPADQSQQRTLFDLESHARKSDPLTSHQAAAKIKQGSRRLEILRKFAEFGRGGASSLGVANCLNRQRDSISPHIKPLIMLGYLEKTGQMIINLQTGNNMELYRVTDKYLTSEYNNG